MAKPGQKEPSCLAKNKSIVCQLPGEEQATARAAAAKLTALAEQPHALLLVTDIEALHPYMRIGVLENEVFGKFITPSVIFYPGTRTGKTRLKFLGFYPEDGNYRSTHIG
jgi:hypothetical protein